MSKLNLMQWISEFMVSASSKALAKDTKTRHPFRWLNFHVIHNGCGKYTMQLVYLSPNGDQLAMDYINYDHQ